jgi:hypothetical protein
MALITVGSVDDFSVVPVRSMTAHRRMAFGDIDTVKVLSLASPLVSPEEFEFPVSTEPRGLALKSIRLQREAQKFFKRKFHLKSNIYVLSWAWDLSGRPVFIYPDLTVGAPPSYISMRGGDVQEFLGSGTVLTPARPVTSGLQIRMQIWQSAKGVRNFGRAMGEVKSALEDSPLNKLLKGLSLISPHAAVAEAAKALALKLVGVVGAILLEYGDSQLDLYEGNFAALDPWPRKAMVEKQRGTEVVLTPLR